MNHSVKGRPSISGSLSGGHSERSEGDGVKGQLGRKLSRTRLNFKVSSYSALLCLSRGHCWLSTDSHATKY